MTYANAPTIPSDFTVPLLAAVAPTVVDVAPPTVTITAPPVTAPGPTVALAGTASSDFAIWAVTYTVNSGPVAVAVCTWDTGGGTPAAGYPASVTNWTAAVPILAGNNLITVTALSSTGLTGTATATVIGPVPILRPPPRPVTPPPPRRQPASPIGSLGSLPPALPIVGPRVLPRSPIVAQRSRAESAPPKAPTAPTGAVIKTPRVRQAVIGFVRARAGMAPPQTPPAGPLAPRTLRRAPIVPARGRTALTPQQPAAPPPVAGIVLTPRTNQRPLPRFTRSRAGQAPPRTPPTGPLQPRTLPRPFTRRREATRLPSPPLRPLPGPPATRTARRPLPLLQRAKTAVPWLKAAAPVTPVPVPRIRQRDPIVAKRGRIWAPYQPGAVPPGAVPLTPRVRSRALPNPFARPRPTVPTAPARRIVVPTPRARYPKLPVRTGRPALPPSTPAPAPPTHWIPLFPRTLQRAAIVAVQRLLSRVPFVQRIIHVSGAHDVTDLTSGRLYATTVQEPAQ